MNHEDTKTRRKIRGLAKTYARVGLALWLCVVSGRVNATLDETLAIRKQYNVVSAKIDSLVRAMREQDASSIETEKLPDGREALNLPDDTQVVAIFWADDEAQVWINDHFIGETRLTPVEVVVPNLYLKSDNVIRAKGWDTDYVESGFLFGLYLKRNGKLHPVVVSDDSWTGVTAPLETITYAHTMPDIPQAEVIWSPNTFGLVEMTTRFSAGRVREAAASTGDTFTASETREMSLHAFVAELSVLETERERLRSELRRRSSTLSVPGFSGQSNAGALTLGKAGPLKEHVTKPVSEKVKAWSEQLPAEQQGLIYPERRRLRGEGEATAQGELAAAAGGVEDRDKAYVPPSDRRNREPGSEDGQPGAAGGGGGEGESEGEPGAAGGGGFTGRSSRLGLLVPTIILAAYAVYATRTWRKLSNEAA